MKVRLNELNQECEALIPPAKPDNSGIGVNYAEAYLKGMATQLPDGRKVVVKRKGLKITVTIGSVSGAALMRKREHGPDVKAILRHAIEEAAEKAGTRFLIEDGVAYLVVAG